METIPYPKKEASTMFPPWNATPKGANKVQCNGCSLQEAFGRYFIEDTPYTLENDQGSKDWLLNRALSLFEGKASACL